MSLTEKINTDLTTAMKSRQRERLDALRLVWAALKNEQIALGHELNDDETIKVLGRLVKQRHEAAQQYRAASRPASADQEEAEAKLIEGYLPQQLTDEKLKNIVNEVVNQTGMSGAADFGRVMGAVMNRVKGAADGNRVSALVRAALN